MVKQAGGGGAKAGQQNAMLMGDVQGTTLVLSTSDGSFAIPASPRPHGAIFFPRASVEEFVRFDLDDDSTDGAAGYMAHGESWPFTLHPDTTNIHASVASGAGTLYVTWVYAGSVGG